MRSVQGSLFTMRLEYVSGTPVSGLVPSYVLGVITCLNLEFDEIDFVVGFWIWFMLLTPGPPLICVLFSGCPTSGAATRQRRRGDAQTAARGAAG